MLDPNEIIEENNGEMFEKFEKEISRLSQRQLKQINVEAGIYLSDRVGRIQRDLLEISIAEVRWTKYFTAYRIVAGEASSLESQLKRS